MQKLNDTNVIVLSPEPYVIDIPVKIYERVRISGYISTSQDENKDAAVIVFDVGDREIDEEILKAHGLKRSKIGIYRYLPVGKKFELWNVDIFIPFKIDTIKVSFRTWKNKDDIIIGTNLNIAKDYAYSKLYRELLECKSNIESNA